MPLLFEEAGLASRLLPPGRAVQQRCRRAACWRRLRDAALAVCEEPRRAFMDTTDAAFIRSEVNGRRSRRIVLFAFFCTDVIGATLWATWCEGWWGAQGGAEEAALRPREAAGGWSQDACSSFGINHFLLLALSVPTEGAMLFLAGRNPWSFWSDGLLLPVWLIRLGLFDVLLWNVPPQALMGDALWFSVMAVMCRVHSLALAILVLSQVSSLLVVFLLHGAPLNLDSFEEMRYGIYSVAMLVMMAGAYALDEQSRLQSFSTLMSLEDRNAALAERLLRWKVLPESSHGATGEAGDGAGTDLAEDSRAAEDRAAEDRATSSVASSLPLGSGSTAGFPTGAGWQQQLDLGFGARSRQQQPSAQYAGPDTAGGGRSGARSVRFCLPKAADRAEEGQLVPTTRPLTGFGQAAQPRGVLDVME